MIKKKKFITSRIDALSGSLCKQFQKKNINIIIKAWRKMVYCYHRYVRHRENLSVMLFWKVSSVNGGIITRDLLKPPMIFFFLNRNCYLNPFNTKSLWWNTEIWIQSSGWFKPTLFNYVQLRLSVGTKSCFDSSPLHCAFAFVSYSRARLVFQAFRVFV